MIFSEEGSYVIQVQGFFDPNPQLTSISYLRNLCLLNLCQNNYIIINNIINSFKQLDYFLHKILSSLAD